MKLKLLTILAVGFVAFFAGCDSKPQKAQEVKKNMAVSESIESKIYNLKTTDGKTITLEASNGMIISKELEGKLVLLNFWATWCPPCIKEMPTFVDMQEKYKDDFIIVGILYEEDKDKKELADFLKEHKINFPITEGPENFVLAKDFGDIKKIPESFLYSKKGFLLEKFVGEVNPEKLETYIKESIK